MSFIHSNLWDHACRTSDHIDLSLLQTNNNIDRESLGEDLAWVEETLLMGSDGKWEMAVVESQVVDENREGLGEAWDFGPCGEIDGSLEDTDMHHWDEARDTSLFGMEQYLDIYNGTFVNGDTAIYEELDPLFPSTLIPPEDCNSRMPFAQGTFRGVVQGEAFLSQTYVDDNMSYNMPGMPTYISSFSRWALYSTSFRQKLIQSRTPEINKSSPSAFHTTPQTLSTVTSVSRKRVRKQRIRTARPIQ
jgi:hypothetical protein